LHLNEKASWIGTMLLVKPQALTKKLPGWHHEVNGIRVCWQVTPVNQAGNVGPCARCSEGPAIWIGTICDNVLQLKISNITVGPIECPPGTASHSWGKVLHDGLWGGIKGPIKDEVEHWKYWLVRANAFWKSFVLIFTKSGRLWSVKSWTQQYLQSIVIQIWPGAFMTGPPW
jgi:hypothetical protein